MSLDPGGAAAQPGLPAAGSPGGGPGGNGPGGNGPGGNGPGGNGPAGGGAPGAGGGQAAGGAGDPGADPGAAGAAPDGQRVRGGRGYADARVGGDFANQHRYESAARNDFRESNIGSMYSGNTIYQLLFGQGAAQVRANTISPEELTAPFEPSQGAERLASMIAGYPFVVLYGPRGYGKCATLLWALRHQVNDESELLYLDPATDLAAFSCDQIPEHAIMIIQDMPDSAVDRLDEVTVKRIESELRAGSRRLAITTTRAAAGAAHTTGFLIAELATRPEPRQVVNRHLTKLLLGTRLAKTDVLGWPGVDALVAELGQDSSLADAARLARLLARADRDDPDKVAALVRAQMTEYADEKVAQWFRKLTSRRARCMAISLAVLNGQSRALIAHEAALLERRIMPAPDAPNAPPPDDPLDDSATVSAALLDARVVSETVPTEHGLIVIDAMRYREPGYPGQVLRYVWRTYDGARAAIVGWLRELGASNSLAVRVRAASATGVLACQALDFLCDQVISRWALSNDEEIRNSAAIALGPAADDPVLRATIRSLVEGWAREDSDWRLRATAARAYGRTVGLASPSASLKGLARLAEANNLGLSVAVANSYCELILEGTGPLAVRVMSEVQQLAGERMREKQAAGRLTLLGLSATRGAPPGMGDNQERLRNWPTLLLMALGNSRLAEPAARLWQLALNDQEIGGMARESLDEWAEAAEGSGELRHSLVQFLLWIAADTRGQHAMVRRAQAWTHRDGRAPATGRALLTALGH
jgi:hypothetical protein